MDRARWGILAACFCVVGFVGSVWYSFQVFFAALTREFGWTRAEGALGFSLFVMVYGLMSPFIGGLLDRFGPRRVMLIGALLLASGFAASSQLTTLWQFYLYFGVLTSVGFGACGWMATVTVLQTWFKRRLATATGIVSAGVGLGIQVLVPLEQRLIETFGWRQTYLLLAAATLLVVVPLAFVMRRGPAAEPPQRPPAAAAPGPAPASPGQPEATWTLRRAVGTRRFWLFWLALLLLSGSVQPLLAHQVVYMMDAGIQAFAAATVAGLIGLASVPAKVAWGLIADRLGREVAYTLGLAWVGVAIGLLWLISERGWLWLPYAYALTMGVGYAVTAALPPIVAADLYRGRSYGAIYGGLNVGSQLGTASAVWVAGAIFDLTGSYGPAFVLALLGAAGGGVCIWLVAPRQSYQRPAVSYRPAAAETRHSGSR
ncbi:MAG: MFS transporter [Chloroflexi bacterium]|nr:MFS transporter [Chloroflexota bacterium]